MSTSTTVYAWEENGFWFLSYKPREQRGAKNKYASKDDAIKDAVIRDGNGRQIAKFDIIWET